MLGKLVITNIGAILTSHTKSINIMMKCVLFCSYDSFHSLGKAVCPPDFEVCFRECLPAIIQRSICKVKQWCWTWRLSLQSLFYFIQKVFNGVEDLTLCTGAQSCWNRQRKWVCACSSNRWMSNGVVENFRDIQEIKILRCWMRLKKIWCLFCNKLPMQAWDKVNFSLLHLLCRPREEGLMTPFMSCHYNNH